MQPKGFWSYARGDDDHLDKMLSDLRKRIAGEVSLLMGHDIGIFLDIHDLRTGDRWADKLRAKLNAASFLIPVLTPRFFNRDWCREEVLTYLRLSQEAGLEPRIFPVRFVEWDDDPDCEVRAALQPFQYMDFSHWRFEGDPTQRSRLENAFANDVKARLKLPPRPAARGKPPEPPVPEAQGAATMAKDAPPPKAPPAPQPKVHVVDPWPKRGDFTSIQAAIDAADPGDRIVVREGTYRESLRLSKVLEIIGEGDVERILVTTDKGNALRVDAPLARVSGLRLRREAWGNDYGVWITGGAAELDDCVVESLSLACVAIKGGGHHPHPAPLPPARRGGRRAVRLRRCAGGGRRVPVFRQHLCRGRGERGNHPRHPAPLSR
jgi:F-box protein 11